MSLKTLAQAQLAAIITAYSDSVATVVGGNGTASGVKDTRTAESELVLAGEDGRDVRVIRCNATTLGTVSKGDVITVGGTEVEVLRTRLDSSGAIISIEYTERV